jgi:hypothetical protein
MKLDSYWTDSAPAFASEAHELPAQVDVAIVGGGFTGLSAALATFCFWWIRRRVA